MSESGWLRNPYLQVKNSGTAVRLSRSEPAIRTCDKSTSPMSKSKEIFCYQYASPFHVWLLKACAHKLLMALKAVAAILILLLVTCLTAVVLHYAGLPAVADKLPMATEFGENLLRVIQNFFMGNVKKKHRLRVYQF
ncbi:hypothetical protein BsWGS_29025 [Bradybaena similaris]